MEPVKPEPGPRYQSVSDFVPADDGETLFNRVYLEAQAKRAMMMAKDAAPAVEAGTSKVQVTVSGNVQYY